ncbi:hypothetical protein AX16_009273 [Volvariella volvacea WC 439]|nr:hypothetical protein AX16_009273 [Volvariella volvacea WC 439]
MAEGVRQPFPPAPNADDPNIPRRYGALVFPGFQALDLFGPLDALNSLAWFYPLELSVIAPTLDPVSTKPIGPAANMIQVKSNFAESIVPTHTIDNPPPLDVLIIPGGMGTDALDIQPVIDFVKRTYPSLKYLLTVCTGVTIASRAGVLDGRKATGNKMLWEAVKAHGPNVDWVPKARWVVDGNIWTSSGVSAGLDATIDLIEHAYGKGMGEKIADVLEYEWHRDSSWDPFAEKLGLVKKE